MRKLIRILTIASVKELIKYKSFFFLIFFLLLADRVIHRYIKAPEKGFDWPRWNELGDQTAVFVFTELPGQLFQWLLTPRTLAIVAGLFLLKQVISLWPSSDMRRMHRKERGRFGIMEALRVLKWYQVVWDALAVGLACILTIVWATLSYIIGWGCWHQTGSTVCLYVTVGLVMLIFPLVMASFSYSSKLAVIRKVFFRARFRLFLNLFFHWRLLWTSWIFFSARIVFETIFVVAIPAAAILFINSFWLRMMIATISATPSYAYLKMASFKFFLEAYRNYESVYHEYKEYYKN